MREDTDEPIVEPLIVADRGDIETRRSAKRDLGKWPWALIGFLLGVALAALFLSGGAPVETGGSATTIAEGFNAGIGEQILGFPDTVNAVIAPGNGRAYELVTWPNRGDVIRRSIPISDFTSGGRIEFDASGQFLAGFVSSDEGQILLSGRPNTVAVIDSDVTGFAWHDTSSADLAWSTDDGGEFQLWVSEDAGRPSLVTRGIGIEGFVSAYGDWGFAITAVPEDDPTAVTTRILDHTGVFVRTIDGFVLDSFHDGRFLVQDMTGSLKLVDNVGSLGLNTVGLTDEVVTAAAFSPQGDRIAMLGFFSLKVVDVLGDELALFESIRAGANQVVWSSDGEFLTVPGFTATQIINVESGEIHTIFEREAVRSFTTVSIPGS